MKVQQFSGQARVGVQVYYYPRGVKNDATIPRVGWIKKPYAKGTSDLYMLPSQDGAVEVLDAVFHISDARMYDHRGLITPAGTLRGCYEFMNDSDASEAGEAKPKAIAKAKASV